MKHHNTVLVYFSVSPRIFQLCDYLPLTSFWKCNLLDSLGETYLSFFSITTISNSDIIATIIQIPLSYTCLKPSAVSYTCLEILMHANVSFIYTEFPSIMTITIKQLLLQHILDILSEINNSSVKIILSNQLLMVSYATFWLEVFPLSSWTFYH